MPDPTAIAALATAATTGVAQIITAIRGGAETKKIEALETAQKLLRGDLDALADQLRDFKAAQRTPTGSYPAIREALPSQPDRETERRIDALEHWRGIVDAALRELERWRADVMRRVETGEKAAQRAREKWIALTASLRASAGKIPVIVEDDRGSTG